MLRYITGILRTSVFILSHNRNPFFFFGDSFRLWLKLLRKSHCIADMADFYNYDCLINF